jgi:DNA processing protein
MIFLGDADYPPLLAMMDDAPPCLIVSGDAGLGSRLNYVHQHRIEASTTVAQKFLASLS